MSPSPAVDFVERVLALRPRVAFFDCDGTLWDLDSGEGFFYFTLDSGLVSLETAEWGRQRYAGYRRGDVSEAVMCGEMCTIYAGVREVDLEAAARDFLEQHIVPRIFPEMQRLAVRLVEAGCVLWAVSSTNQWLIRAAVERFHIPAERVLAGAAAVRDGVISGELVRLPSGPGKAQAIAAAHGNSVDAAFGNAIWDAQMLEMARHPFAVNPNPDLAALAAQRGWTIYRPAAPGN